MPSSMRLAAAIALVAVIGVGALAFINRGPAIGNQPTVAPTILNTPTPTIPALRSGVLTAGQYSYDGQGVRVVMTVPEGWQGSAFAVSNGRELPDGASLLFRQPLNVFTDPCAPEGSATAIGEDVDDLVTVLASLPNVTAVEQATATIGEFSGTHLTFTVDTKGIECVMGLYGQGAFIRAAENGQHEDLWILDVAGTRLVIDMATFPETSGDDRAELQAIVDTLLIEPD